MCSTFDGGALPADETGWERVDVWYEPSGVNLWGDEAVCGFTTLYTKGDLRIEDDYYVERRDYWADGTAAVEVDELHEAGPFVVTNRMHYYRVDAEGENLGIEEDYEYPDPPDALFYDDLDRALASAKRFALMDWRDVYLWNPNGGVSA